MRVNLAWIAACLLASAAWGQAIAPPGSGPGGRPGAGAGPTGKLILDQGAYWRYYVEFGRDRLDPQALRNEADGILDVKAIEALQKRVNHYGRPPYAPADETKTIPDWRDRAWIWFSAGQGDNDRAALNCQSPPPPEDWFKPDFDASCWDRQRLPLMVGNMLRPSLMHGDKDMQQLGVGRACFRTTFDLPDPASAGELVLNLAYRGGARVFINGVEVARRHLPGGQLPPDAQAEVYPKEAYLCLPEEIPPQKLSWETKHVGVIFCEDLPGRFEDAFADPVAERVGKEYWTSVGSSRFAGYFGGFTAINRKGFERITALRNRTAGPLKIPASLLRKGANVLAVEVVASNIHPIAVAGQGGNWGEAFQRVMYWAHCRLLELELRSGSPAAASAMERPPGVRVWVEDMHRRCFTADFGEAGTRPGVVRFAGALGGTYSAQIVIGTDRQLSGLKVTPGPLAGAGGAIIPASAISAQFMAAEPAKEMVKLGQIRNMAEDRQDPLCPPAEQAILRYGSPPARTQRLPRAERLKELERLSYFDRITAEPAQTVPGGQSQGLPSACQPVWLSLAVPPAAAGGMYKGEIKVEADGVPPVALRAEAEVINWRLPQPRDFQTVLALEQSPYGVARQYGVGLWSEEHFRLMEASFRQLARVGNGLVIVPVLRNMEFGNFNDGVIGWIRRKDGTLGFDYANLDRYLDLAVKHLGRPRIICFAVMHGADRFGPGDGIKAEVSLLDESTGKMEVLDLGNQTPSYRENWKVFATSLAAHMQARGLDGCMYWGLGWDCNADDMILPLLGEFLPQIKWVRSSHGSKTDRYFRVAMSSLGWDFTETSLMGWRRQDAELLTPRSGSTVLSSNGHAPPFTWRLMANRALVAGANGIGRIGADYWADIFFRGYKGALSGGIAGMPCSSVLWPGKAGAEPSARFEALREGVQEAEARIFLEQALTQGKLPAEVAERARRVLFEHNRQSLYVSPARVGVQVHEYSAGWQERARALYQAAAEVASAVPFQVEKMAIMADIPARAKTTVPLRLRNWSPRPTAWKASAGQPWIVLSSSEGSAAGTETLAVTLDATALLPNQPAKGELTITEVATGREHAVAVAARVGKVLELVAPEAFDFLGAPGHAAAWNPRPIDSHLFLNVAVGESVTRELPLANHSGAEATWKIASPVGWLKVAPAAGKLKAGERTFVKATATPPDSSAILHETILKVLEGDGAAAQDVKVVTSVIPAYKAPAMPAGAPVELSSLPKAQVKLHKSPVYWLGSSDRNRADFGPRFGPSGQIPGSDNAAATTLFSGPSQITVFDLEGGGYAAFSARVRIPAGYQKPTPDGTNRVRLNFEVHVDGQLRAQSGLMGPSDEARTLAVADLAGAKELKLITRFDAPEARNLGKTMYVTWLEPRLYRGQK